MTAFSALVTGSFADNPHFKDWLFTKMDASAVAGANAVTSAHLKVVVGWQGKPSFTQKDVSDMGRLLAMREVRVTGPNAWKWILTNYGGSTLKNGPIVGKFMRFPFQGRGRSYLAATDTGGRGQRVGAPTVFFNITERSVRARNMIGTVSRNSRANIFAAMRSAF